MFPTKYEVIKTVGILKMETSKTPCKAEIKLLCSYSNRVLSMKINYTDVAIKV